MGGSGSGRRWHCGAKSTTNDFRALDVRRWQRDGLLTPGQFFRSYWTRNGKEVASINIMTETERVILAYRYQPSFRTPPIQNWNKRRHSVHRAGRAAPCDGL